MSLVAARVHVTAVGSLLPPCWSLRTILLLGPYQSERHMLPPGFMMSKRPKLLLLMAMSRPMVLLQLGSVLMPIAHVSTGPM